MQRTEQSPGYDERNFAIALESDSEGEGKLDRQCDIPWKMGMNDGREHTLNWRRPNRLDHVKIWLPMMSHRWRKKKMRSGR